MATPSSANALVLPGNLRFSAGGLPVTDLTGAIVKSITTGGLATVQLADGTEGTVQLTADTDVGATIRYPNVSYSAVTGTLTFSQRSGDPISANDLLAFEVPSNIGGSAALKITTVVGSGSVQDLHDLSGGNVFPSDLTAGDWAIVAHRASERVLIVPDLGNEGLTQNQVDARVEAGVLDWAEDGDASDIPRPKIPGGLVHVANQLSTYANNRITLTFDDTVAEDDLIVFSTTADQGTGAEEVSIQIGSTVRVLYDDHAGPVRNDGLEADTWYAAVVDSAQVRLLGSISDAGYSIHGIADAATPDGSDRVPFSDEGATGDPDAYIEWDDLVALVRNMFIYTKSRPQASEANLHDLAISALDRSGDICLNVPTRTSEATGTWADIVIDATTPEIEYTLGEEYVTSPVLDRFYYDRFRDDFWAGTDVGGGRIVLIQDVADDALADFLFNTADTVVWLHQHASDAEALTLIPTVLAGHEYFYWSTADEAIRKLDGPTFAAAGSVTDHYIWRQVFGSETSDATQLVDGASISGSVAAYDLGEEIDAGSEYEFWIFPDGADEPSAEAVISGRRLRDLAEQTSAPATLAGAVGIKIIHVSEDSILGTSFGHSTLWVWRGAADSDGDRTLHLALARNVSATVDVWRIPLAGAGGGSAGAASSEQQAGSSARSVTEFVTQDTALGGTTNNVQFSAGLAWNLFNSGGIEKDAIHEIVLVFGVGPRYDILIRIPKAVLDVMGYHATTSWDWTDSGDRIPAAYWSSEIGSLSHTQSHTFRPNFFTADARRQADTQSLFVFVRDNGSSIFGIAVVVSAGTQALYLRRAVVIHD